MVQGSEFRALGLLNFMAATLPYIPKAGYALFRMYNGKGIIT